MKTFAYGNLTRKKNIIEYPLLGIFQSEKKKKKKKYLQTLLFFYDILSKTLLISNYKYKNKNLNILGIHGKY